MRAPLRVIAIFLALARAAICAEGFQAGLGRADITPAEPIRLAGYASRTKPSESVAQHLFTKALAVRDPAGQLTIIITADTIGVPRWFTDQLAGRIEAELKVPRERIVFACSHSHSTPVIDGCLTDMYGLAGAEAEAVSRYTKFFLEQAFAAAQGAAYRCLYELFPIAASAR